MRRTSYQQGSLKLAERKKGKVWEFRWREVQIDGSIRRKNIVIGTLDEYPNESSAQGAVDAIRLEINQQTPQQLIKNVTLDTLVSHYRQHELPDIFNKVKPVPDAAEEDRNAWMPRQLGHLRRRHRADPVAAVDEHEPLAARDPVPPQPQRDLLREGARRLLVRRGGRRAEHERPRARDVAAHVRVRAADIADDEIVLPEMLDEPPGIDHRLHSAATTPASAAIAGRCSRRASQSDSAVAPTSPAQAGPTADQQQIRKQHRAERKARHADKAKKSPEERKAAKARRTGAAPEPPAAD